MARLTRAGYDDARPGETTSAAAQRIQQARSRNRTIELIERNVSEMEIMLRQIKETRHNEDMSTDDLVAVYQATQKARRILEM